MNPVRDEQQLCELLGIGFTDQQLTAITAGLDQPGVIIAGAGSGKTSVMAARVVWLVGHLGVPPEQVLGLTFTNKAAAELGQRIRASLQLLGADADGDPTTSTYHAFAGSLITEHGLRLGVEPDLRLVTDASRFQRMARAIESFPDELRDVTTHVPSLVSQAMSLDAQLSEHLVEPEVMRAHDEEVIREFLSAAKPPAVLRDAASTAHKRIELSHLVDRYRAGKAHDGVMDFSDQMAWGARLALLPEVGAVLRERFGIVLLDEYQDTSVAQRDLLQALFSGPEAENGRGFPVTAVGDPAQAIYGWRGAAVGNLENFLDDFPRADGGRGRQYSLTETRRCAPEIIDAANHIAAPFYATSEAVQPLASATAPGGRVVVGLYDTIDAEITAMIDAITATPGPRRDIAILVRVARENGAIVQALREAHVPFEIVGLEGLLSQPEVLDLLALLEVVEDVTANPAMLRLLTGPRWRIGPRDLALLGRRASTLTSRLPGRDDDSTLEAELRRAVEGTDPTEIVSLADAVDDPGASCRSPLRRGRGSWRSPASSPRCAPTSEIRCSTSPAGECAPSTSISSWPRATSRVAPTTSPCCSRPSPTTPTPIGTPRCPGWSPISTPSASTPVAWRSPRRRRPTPSSCSPSTGPRVWSGPRSSSRSSRARSSRRGADGHDGSPVPRRSRVRCAATPTACPPSRSGRPRQEGLRAADREDALMEERRLAYVAFTRAARRLTVTGHYWGRTQQKPLGPSEFLITTREWLGERGIEPIHWADPPEQESTNPHLVEADGIAWPAAGPGLDGRRALAADVRAALEGRLDVPEASTADEAELDRLAALEHDLELLAVEAAESVQDVRLVPWPSRMSATSALALTKDPEEFARSLARPMPRRPSSAARFGTRFHAWIEDHYGMVGLFDPTDLPGRGDAGIDNDTELERLKETFLASEFAARTPEQIEAPFSLVLGGQQFGGRIDAAFSTTDTDGGKRYEVVDWKTNEKANADPLQLSIYRLAWAELMGVDLDRVSAAFYYVRLGETVRPGPDELLDRAGLEQALGLLPQP